MWKYLLWSACLTLLVITTPLNFLSGNYFTAIVGTMGIFVWFTIIFMECDK